VSGLLDGDCAHANHERWTEPGLDLFVLPAHELENLLLDFEALAVVSGRATAQEVEQAAREHAERLVWWLATSEVQRAIYKELPRLGEAPSMPGGDGVGICDQASALAHLGRPEYWAAFAPFVERWSGTRIETALAAQTARLRDELGSRAWLRSFPGKELLRHLRSRVPGLDTTWRGPPQSSTALDIDLAGRVAEQLRARPPDELAELQRILRSRVHGRL
jgi:hypothetical protein